MPTARDRARTETTTLIVEAARRQLAEVGAQQLSLRAVAREVGMVSSAVYRYFPSRDELLTRLIVDAYESLGARAADAERQLPREDYRGRWRVTCGAVRQWAVDNPHEYALVYGSPVPGYAAPTSTVEPAGRVAMLLVAVLRDAAAAGALDPPGTSPSGRRGLSTDLLRQARQVGDQIAPGLAPELVARLLATWAQLFGLVSFELFGHFVGSADPAGPLFDHTVERMADHLGLPPARRRAADR